MTGEIFSEADLFQAKTTLEQGQEDTRTFWGNVYRYYSMRSKLEFIKENAKRGLIFTSGISEQEEAAVNEYFEHNPAMLQFMQDLWRLADSQVDDAMQELNDPAVLKHQTQQILPDATARQLNIVQNEIAFQRAETKSLIVRTWLGI